MCRIYKCNRHSKKYIETTTVTKKALVVGIEQLSKYINKNDTGTSIILSDGAGAVLFEGTSEKKKYYSKHRNNNR